MRIFLSILGFVLAAPLVPQYQKTTCRKCKAWSQKAPKLHRLLIDSPPD